MKKVFGDLIAYYNELGKLHRDNNLPAIEAANGDKEWYVNGKRHRTDGPAIERNNGDKKWYINGKLHRTDGPASILITAGAESWYINDKLHRENGPAMKFTDGDNFWYLNGKKYTEEEHNLKIKLERLKKL